MPQRGSADQKPYPYMYFTTVNRRVDPFLMKDDELWDSVNFWTERRVGAKKVRPGLSLFMDRIDTSAVRGLFYVKFPNGNRRIIRISGGKIYSVDPNVATSWGSVRLTNANAFVRPDYTVLTGKVFIVSRVSSTEFHLIEGDATDTYTDTNYTSGSDPVVPSKAATCCTYHRRVYVGDVYDGTNEFSSMIGWSSIDYANKGTSPASPWTTQTTLIDQTFASNRHIDRDYKGAIFKITNINDRLNIYKEEGIYRYNETSVFDIFGLSPIQGSIATMQETKEDYFFTNEGFFKTDGKESKPIGQGWYEIIKQILQNNNDATKIHSFAGNFMYFCYLGNVTYDSKTVANACFVYNALLDEMYLWSFGMDISSIGYYISNNKEKIIVMGDASGYTYKLDYNADDDNGIPITAFAKTKHFFFDSPYMYNSISEFYGFCSPGSELEVATETDFSGEPHEFTSLSQVFGSGRVDISRVGQFRTLSFELFWNGKGKRPEFWGIIPVITEASERIP